VISVNEQICNARDPAGGSAGKKAALAAGCQRQISAEVEALIGMGAIAHLDFEAIETAARH
jgi:hypothetical protein